MWNTNEHINEICQLITDKTTWRKARLFACACCRGQWELLKDHRSRNAIRVAEEFADGNATAAELSLAWDDACAASCEAEREFGLRTDDFVQVLLCQPAIVAAIKELLRSGLTIISSGSSLDADAEVPLKLRIAERIAQADAANLVEFIDSVSLRGQDSSLEDLLLTHSERACDLWRAKKASFVSMVAARATQRCAWPGEQFDTKAGLAHAKSVASLMASIDERNHLVDAAKDCFEVHFIDGLRPISLSDAVRSRLRGYYVNWYSCDYTEFVAYLSSLRIQNELVESHFRERNVHYRGCWALDILIGQ